MIYKLYRRTAASEMQFGYIPITGRTVYPTGLIITDNDIIFVENNRPVEVVLSSGNRCHKVVGHRHMWAVKNQDGWRVGKVGRWVPVGEDQLRWADEEDVQA